MFNAFSSTIGGSSVRLDDGASAEELWKFVLHGIGTPPPASRTDGGQSARYGVPSGRW